MGFFNERLLEVAMFTFIFTIFVTGLTTFDAAVNEEPIFGFVDLPNNFALDQFKKNYIERLNTSGALDGGITEDDGGLIGAIIPDAVENAANWTSSILWLFIAFLRNIFNIGLIITTPIQALFDIFNIGAAGSVFVDMIGMALTVGINILNLRFLIALWRGV